MCVYMYRWMDGWMDGRTDGRMDGCACVRAGVRTYVCIYMYKVFYVCALFTANLSHLFHHLIRNSRLRRPTWPADHYSAPVPESDRKMLDSKGCLKEKISRKIRKPILSHVHKYTYSVYVYIYIYIEREIELP